MISLHAERLRREGFTILVDAFPPPPLAHLNPGAPPLVEDARFLELATHPELMALTTALLGANFVLLQQNVIVSPSGSAAGPWHRDLAGQEWTCSEVLGVSALFCVDAFTASNGGATVLPGSHLAEYPPSAEFVALGAKPIEASAGSIVVFDALLFHRGGANTSGQTRRTLNHVIGRPFLQPSIDLPRALGGKHKQDPFLSKYLGYRWNPAESVEAWRTRPK